MRFMREPEVVEKTQLSRVTIWRLEKEGRFPRRRQVANNSVRWLENEVEEWMETRTFAGDAEAG